MDKKKAIICLVIWTVVVLSGCISYYSITEKMNKDFYSRGISSAQKIAEEVRVPLLDYLSGKTVSALNEVIGNFSNNNALKFIQIIDYDDIVVAHTDNKAVNRFFVPLKDRETLDKKEEVQIEQGFLPDNEEEKLINFSLGVLVDETKIGEVHYVMSASYLKNSLITYKIIFIAGAIISILLLVLILTLLFRGTVKREKIGPYELQYRIAKGGMAELLLAVNKQEGGFRRVVVVKRILEHFFENKDFLEMFKREAKLASLLYHPNIVQIIDFREKQNAIVMEYIDGRNLADMMDEIKKPFSIDQAVFIAMQICNGLLYAHAKKDEIGNPLNIVHRDIKPSNILISFEGEVKIGDFGISKAIADPGGYLTKAGDIKGTLSYMSPEQASGELNAIDQRSDIYSFGIVFYEMLCWKKLYRFGTDVSIVKAIRKITEEDIEPLVNIRKNEVPHELNDIVMKCLEKDKNKRYQNAQEVIDALILLKKNLNLVYDTPNLASYMKKNFESKMDRTITRKM